jgi:mRNA interferase HigB
MSYIVWSDTGPHFRCAEFYHFLFNELAREKIKVDFNSVDYVSNQRYVFDIKGNKYRIIVVIIFIEGLFSIRFVGTHAEYSKIDAKYI